MQQDELDGPGWLRRPPPDLERAFRELRNPLRGLDDWRLVTGIAIPILRTLL